MVNVVKAPDTDENTALQAAIAAADGAAAVPVLAANPGETDDDDEDVSWSDIPRLAGSFIVPAMPELAPIYSDKACDNWGRLIDKLAKKHGFDGAGLPIEAMVLLSTAGFVAPTLMAIRARRLQPPPPPAAPAPAPGANNAPN